MSLVIVFRCGLLDAGERASDDLERGFADPPASARPAGYWAWMNGHADVSRFAEELDEWKAKGLSKAYIFECGARDPDGIVPAGPAFMSPASVKIIARAIREAKRAGIELGLTTSSSWNAGGSWVTPEHASKALLKSEVAVVGPTRFSKVLPLPKIPARAPKHPDGRPVFLQDVAVLAVPAPKTLPGYEFVLSLAPPGPHRIDRFVLFNGETEDAKRTGGHLFAKEFAVAVSTTTPDAASFREVLRGTLEPRTGAQTFRIAPTPARHLRLTILSGHNARQDAIELAEFEAVTTAGKNIALHYRVDGTGGGATLRRYTSAQAAKGNGSAGNVHDGAFTGPGGLWRSGSPARFVENADAIVDLSDRIDAEGRLTWDVPPGPWTILRFVCTNTGQGLAIPSPNSHGLAIDHFSAEATRMHFAFFFDTLEAAVGPLRETSLTTMYICSYELRGVVWTPKFLEEFRQRRGYDMTKFLPVLFGSRIENQDVTERFDHDYRKTQGDLLVDAFYKTATDVCHEHGLLLCAEAGGPGAPTHNVPVDALKAQGVIDIPRGEFWTDLHLQVVKETACAAHIYGKPVVDMEAFTGWGHWQHGPFDLKPFADRALCEGTNHFTFHTSPHRPKDTGLPGWAYHAGTHIAPSIAWWPQAGAFLDYLSRSCFLLQQGQFVGDVCYYYGDQAYNFVPPKHVDPSLGPGFDYDVTNSDVILTRMSVKDGRIVLPDGTRYELLVLPERDAIPLTVLRKLEQLVRDGATLVGRKPSRSNGLHERRRRDGEIRRLADRLWGPCDGKTVLEHAHGKGRVVWGRRLRDVLQSRGVGPDFAIRRGSDKADIDFVHRRRGDVDIYFLSNRTTRWAVMDGEFRVKGKRPEIWSPETGTAERVGVYRATPRGTELPMRLPPGGSALVVFRGPVDPDHLVSARCDARDARAIDTPDLPAITLSADEDTPGRVTALVTRDGPYTLTTARGRTLHVETPPIDVRRDIPGPWRVRFPPDRGAPAEVVLDRLIAWSRHAQAGVRYFSGVATYEKEVEIPPASLAPGARLFLDLGRVEEIAEVQLNGTSVGVVWKPPYRVDVTGAARPGRNQLMIAVANTWSNRLAGDAQSPDGPQICQTNITHSVMWKTSWKDTPLKPSGLLGPVRWIPAREIVIDTRGGDRDDGN